MSKTLAVYMMLAATAIIMVSLVIGISFGALADKNTKHEEMLQNEHQLKINY
ncbi:hypothetical protein M3612_20010 [Niallia taxi]|uniref:hypothetical protein n=1 Tax=Niallia taxi TaxID=2499688 RepID=UPI00203BF3CC|nr:hypothetical protein [Niallia taxi]MCM3216774.1 hypothetical protein [Niallia taxi]